MVNLRLDIYELDTHAQEYMSNLGITYQIAVPQSIGDQWWFFNCKNVPKVFDSNLTILNGKIESFIGWGLSLDDVAQLHKSEIEDNG